MGHQISVNNLKTECEDSVALELSRIQTETNRNGIASSPQPITLNRLPFSTDQFKQELLLRSQEYLERKTSKNDGD
uniref:Uncharacterized protein n=1 Tax=Sarcoptes scabiei TaxID=52283 RepID=A0A834R1F6_SARSC